MATVAIIDADSKTRQEMRMYLKELGIDDIKEFVSGREFEKSFFASLIEKAKPKKPVPAAALEIPAHVVKILTSSEFNFEPAFTEDICELEFAADKGLIVKSSATKLFGKTATELIAKSVKLETLLHKEFVKAFSDFTQELAKEKRPEHMTLLFVGEKNQLWVVQCDSKLDGKKIILILKNITLEAASGMGRAPVVKEKKENDEKIKPLDLVLFRYTDVDPDVKKWVTKSATLLKKVNLWPVENRTKFIAMRYEDDPKEKAEYNHPFIDDLLCFPLDRLIFLQKVELTLALPKKVAPSHLYVQPVKDPVEISKRITIERVSDLGIAVTNPIPLAHGTVGHFYFRFPGQKALLSIYGKVCSSLSHPERPGEFLTYFNFFGLEKNPLKEVKAYLARDSAYKNLIEMKPDKFQFSPENLFMSDEQKRKKTTVLLDFDEHIRTNISDYIKKEIQNHDVVTDDTYYSFFKKHLSQKATQTKAPAAMATDFYADSVSILISSANMNIQMMLTTPSETDLFFGFEALKIFAEPQGWMKFFDGDSKNLLIECINLVKNMKRVVKLFEVVTADNQHRSVTIEFIAEDNSEMVRLNFKLPDPISLGRETQQQKIESLDNIIIDYDLLPEDIQAFLNAITEACKTIGLYCPQDGPKVIVTAAENKKINFERLLNSKIFGFIYKPIEIRRILFLVSLATDNQFTIYNFENVGWKQDHIPAKIARESQLVELSEFGAAVRTSQPIKPGTMLYLFQSIFSNAPDQNLCARVYFSEEDEKEEGFYLNSLVYFGITDAFLKYTRAYIREKYAANKSKDGQS